MSKVVDVQGHDYHVVYVPETFASGGKRYGSTVDHSQETIFVCSLMPSSAQQQAEDQAISQARHELTRGGVPMLEITDWPDQDDLI